MHFSYKILEINDLREFLYESTYYDTDDFTFYHQHHNEKRNRYKIRYRKYNSTNNLFFEIKKKNNKNRTIKKRILVENINNDLKNKEMELIQKNINCFKQNLNQKLIIDFKRITFANNDLTERLTVDLNLSVKNEKIKKIFDKLVVSEIKQDKYNPKSEFIQILRKMKIPEMRFSKYCMGILHTYNHIKFNRFKPKLTQINKILK